MSIADSLNSIRLRLQELPKDADLSQNVLKELPSNPKLEELEEENIIKTFLSPNHQFSSKWLDQLQEYVS